MPSYSVNLNAVVAQAATAVTRLQAVCAYGGSDTQVCVASAANLAAAGGQLRGVALESAAAGFPIQIIDFGSVNNPGMAGSGAYVAYDGSGNLVRQAALTAQVVGLYENGVIHVNLGYAALAAAAGVTWLVVTDPAFGAKGDGSSDDTAAFVAAIAAKEALASSCIIYVPAGTYKLTSAIDIGTKSFVLRGDGWRLSSYPRFGSAAWGSGIVSGSVLKFTNATNGLVLSTYPAANIYVEDLFLLGPGSGDTTGFYEQAEGGVVRIGTKNLGAGNWYRGVDYGGAEESWSMWLGIFGCVYGLPIEGTPIAKAGQTNSEHISPDIQYCTYGIHQTIGTGIHIYGAPLLQNDGLGLTITGATNASPIVLTVSSTTELRTGMTVTVANVGGNTAANGRWASITVVDATHVSLDGSTGSGAYTTGGSLYAGGGYVVQPGAGQTVNVCSITGAWFENNGSFGLDFDVGVATAGITNFDVTRCQFGGGAAGDLGQNALHFQTPGAGSSINRLEIATCKANSLDLVIPSAGVYGCDRNNTLQTFTNNYPTGWLHIDYASACQFPSLTVNAAALAASFGANTGTLSTTGLLRAANNTTIVAARNAANSADLRVLSTDNANDLFVGNTTNFAATYVLGPAVYLGNAGSLFAMQLAASVEYHSLPILGGDTTGSTPASPYSVHGEASSSLGDSDQALASSQYSRQRCEFTGAWTAARKRTFPTPSGVNGYYEKTIVNSTTGGFAVTVSCGAGATVSVANGKTAICGFRSTGDVVRVTADV